MSFDKTDTSIPYGKIASENMWTRFAFTCIIASLVDGQMPIEQTLSCGTSSFSGIGLMYGGHTFAKGSWPWMVAMMYKRDETPLKFFCSGTLVTHRKIVTGKMITKMHPNLI